MKHKLMPMQKLSEQDSMARERPQRALTSLLKLKIVLSLGNIPWLTSNQWKFSVIYKSISKCIREA